MVKGFLHKKCMVLQYKLYVQRGSSFQHLIVAGHRHRCRCSRYRHSGILASIVLVGYRTGPTYSSTGLVPALVFFFWYRVDRMRYPPASNFCSSFPSLPLVDFPAYTVHSMACFRDNFQDHRRLLEQLLEAQITIGCRKCNNLPEEGYRKDFHN